MKSPTKKHYTAEFKAQALELLSLGKPVTQVAEELCISSNLLYNWRKNAVSSQGGSEGLRAVGEVSAADELRALRRDNALLKQENDILKKAAIILGTRAQTNSGK